MDCPGCKEPVLPGQANIQLMERKYHLQCLIEHLKRGNPRRPQYDRHGNNPCTTWKENDEPDETLNARSDEDHESGTGEPANALIH